MMYVRAILVLVGLVVQRGSLVSPDQSVLEDSRLDFQGLVHKYGYPVELHKVVTSDGYILTLHRIPYGRKCGADGAEKVPVLLLHGLFDSSISWIITGPEKSLAYILADRCYDVWLGNSRGNHESNEHRTLSRHSRAYWDFSWHEMGAYDLPTFIEHVLTVTNQNNLHYIGHSQGTTAFFVFNSLYPHFSSRIRSFQALAPVAYVAHMRSPLVRLTAPFSGIAGVTFFPGFANVLAPNDFFEVNEISAELGRQICRDRNSLGQLLCSNILFLVGGFNSEQLNTTLLPAIVSHTPAGASTKQLVHYGQNVRSGGFRQYDYTWLLNPLKYGTLEPPSYNLRNVLAPVALHYSMNDWFVDVADLDRLASELPNLIGKFLVPLPKFSHLDFLWAIDVKTLLYDRVLEIMSNY